MWLIELFRAVEQALGKREIIAEDLGYMSETVRQLVRDSGFPGMPLTPATPAVPATICPTTTR